MSGCVALCRWNRLFLSKLKQRFLVSGHHTLLKTLVWILDSILTHLLILPWHSMHTCRWPLDYAREHKNNNGTKSNTHTQLTAPEWAPPRLGSQKRPWESQCLHVVQPGGFPPPSPHSSWPGRGGCMCSSESSGTCRPKESRWLAPEPVEPVQSAHWMGQEHSWQTVNTQIPDTTSLCWFDSLII